DLREGRQAGARRRADHLSLSRKGPGRAHRQARRLQADARRDGAGGRSEVQVMRKPWSSSPRKRGPILRSRGGTTSLGDLKLLLCFKQAAQGLWVPAFAGTTLTLAQPSQC